MALDFDLAPHAEIVEYPDANTLAAAAAARILLRVGDVLAQRSRDCDFTHRFVDIALTGGGDGTRTLQAMAANPLCEAIDWQRVNIWWGDERFVAADSPERNAVQARHALLDQLVERGLLPEANIHEAPADPRSAAQIAAASDEENRRAVEAAAAAYEEELHGALGQYPRMDIAWFGVGPEGHIASLFPGEPSLTGASTDSQAMTLSPRTQLVVGVPHSPKPPALRVSFTAAMIQRSHDVWITASSTRKRDALRAGLVREDNPAVPVSFAHGTHSALWMVDSAANPLRS